MLPDDPAVQILLAFTAVITAASHDGASSSMVAKVHKQLIGAPRTLISPMSDQPAC
jgi:hypothetical protein